MPRLLIAIVHGAVLLAAIGGIGLACAWMMRRSRLVGAIVVAGVAVRVISGAGLFAITQTSLLAGAHSGDGFWNLAPDARAYFALASDVAANGLFSVPSYSASPFYLNVLGFWMQVSGVFVLNAVFFNVICYVIACAVVVRAAGRPSRSDAAKESWRDAVPVLVPLIGLTASPLLLLSSTQVLKDSLFMLLMVMACVGMLRILAVLPGPSPSGPLVMGWTAMVALAQFGIAGIRPYFSVVLWLAVAAGLLFMPWFALRERRGRMLVATLMILAVCWSAFMAGAGAYYPYYGQLIGHVTGLQIPGLTTSFGGTVTEVGVGAPEVAVAGDTFLTLRRGFIRTGGGTILTNDEGGGSLSAMALDTAFGLAATFVPITVLNSLGIVDLQGGRGLLVLTDLDTLFMDLMLIAVAVVLYRYRSLLRSRLSSILFALVLGTVCSVLMAYVVTNFGTLFRLRVLAVVPLWLIPLVVADRTRNDRPPCAA